MEIIVNSHPVIAANYFRARNSNIESVDGGVIVEQPLSISVNGDIFLTLMCTPVDLKELALGFLYNEGIINNASEIRLAEVHPSNQMVEVWLNKSVEKPANWRITSGCAGGMTSVKEETKNIISQKGITVTTQQIIGLGNKLFEGQSLYQEGGGIHASALSDGETLLVVCEDIGRHNTLDKIAGKIILNQIEIANPILLTSGRISSEMMQKASRIGSPIVVSRTSPTSSSIKLAEDCGITLIGYACGSQFKIYTNPQRIQEFTEGKNPVEDRREHGRRTKNDFYKL